METDGLDLCRETFVYYDVRKIKTSEQKNLDYIRDHSKNNLPLRVYNRSTYCFQITNILVHLVLPLPVLGPIFFTSC